jgi:hypothetical protein
MLSQETRIAIVAYFAFGSPKFAYVENGALICGFDIMDPETRGGEAPDFLLSNLIETGLLPISASGLEIEEEELEESESAENEEEYRVFQAISLAVQFTGLSFDRQVIESPQYLVSMADFYETDHVTKFIY